MVNIGIWGLLIVFSTPAYSADLSASTLDHDKRLINIPTGKQRLSPLHVAVINGWHRASDSEDSAVTSLIMSGADIHQTDVENKTCIDWAHKYGMQERVDRMKASAQKYKEREQQLGLAAPVLPDHAMQKGRLELGRGVTSHFPDDLD